MTIKFKLDEKQVVVGLGHRCEIAWQIRAFFGQDEAYPFDWLVTPMQAVALMIEEDFASIADPGFLQVTQYGNGAGWSVIHTRYQILLHHDFERTADGRIVDNWLDNIERVQGKFAHLRERWIRLMASDKDICFVRRLGNLAMPNEAPIETTPADYERLMVALRKRAPRARLNFLFIDCDNVPAAADVGVAAVGYPTVADWANPEDRWKGKTVAYRKVFSEVLAPTKS